jgi:hypothetical protein
MYILPQSDSLHITRQTEHPTPPKTKYTPAQSFSSKEEAGCNVPPRSERLENDYYLRLKLTCTTMPSSTVTTEDASAHEREISISAGARRVPFVYASARRRLCTSHTDGRYDAQPGRCLVRNHGHGSGAGWTRLPRSVFASRMVAAALVRRPNAFLERYRGGAGAV